MGSEAEVNMGHISPLNVRRWSFCFRSSSRGYIHCGSVANWKLKTLAELTGGTGYISIPRSCSASPSYTPCEKEGRLISLISLFVLSSKERSKWGKRGVSMTAETRYWLLPDMKMTTVLRQCNSYLTNILGSLAHSSNLPAKSRNLEETKGEQSQHPLDVTEAHWSVPV